MPSAILATAYMAPVQYYHKLATFDHISIEAAEHYPKQTYRNRCQIATAAGVQALTVPVEKYAPQTPVRDIRISGHGNWRALHWHALVSAYNLSPFFEYYADDFRPFYEKKYTYLFEYNELLREMICGLLDLHPAIEYTKKYEPEADGDFRAAIDPRHPQPDPAFAPRPYYQVFRDRHGFLPNMSIVDLLFNTGTEAIVYLTHDSQKTNSPI